MKVSFLRNKINKLKNTDLLKNVIDILLPDISNIGDYNPLMMYRKGEKVFYYDKSQNKSYILKATQYIPPNPSGEMNFDQWKVINNNAEAMENLEVGSDGGSIKYEGATLNNVWVQPEKPEKMKDRDLWFSVDEEEVEENGR